MNKYTSTDTINQVLVWIRRVHWTWPRAPADLPGFLPASCAKVASSPSESFFPDDDDDVFLPSTDVPMIESSPFKRTLRSSRSTDAKTSETPVVDDVPQPPPNSSPGEPQQQRVYKKANKRVNKKVKRESWEREFSPKNHNP